MPFGLVDYVLQIKADRKLRHGCALFEALEFLGRFMLTKHIKTSEMN